MNFAELLSKFLSDNHYVHIWSGFSIYIDSLANDIPVFNSVVIYTYPDAGNIDITIYGPGRDGKNSTYSINILDQEIFTKVLKCLDDIKSNRINW